MWSSLNFAQRFADVRGLFVWSNRAHALLCDELNFIFLLLKCICIGFRKNSIVDVKWCSLKNTFNGQ
jgi:hypothetical protein